MLQDNDPEVLEYKHAQTKFRNIIVLFFIYTLILVLHEYMYIVYWGQTLQDFQNFKTIDYCKEMYVNSVRLLIGFGLNILVCLVILGGGLCRIPFCVGLMLPINLALGVFRLIMYSIFEDEFNDDHNRETCLPTYTFVANNTTR